MRKKSAPRKSLKDDGEVVKILVALLLTCIGLTAGFMLWTGVHTQAAPPGYRLLANILTIGYPLGLLCAFAAFVLRREHSAALCLIFSTICLSGIAVYQNHIAPVFERQEIAESNRAFNAGIKAEALLLLSCPEGRMMALARGASEAERIVYILSAAEEEAPGILAEASNGQIFRNAGPEQEAAFLSSCRMAGGTVFSSLEDLLALGK